MMKRIVAFWFGLYCVFMMHPEMSLAALISSSGDAALTNGNTITFNGNYAPSHEARVASLTIDGVTFSGSNDIEIEITNYSGVTDYAHLGNGYKFTFYSNTIRFDFTENIEAFAFLLGASNNNWVLTAYNASDVQLDQHVLPTTGGTSSAYYGIKTPGSSIAYATLTDTSGSDLIFIDNFMTGPASVGTGGSVKIYNIADSGTYDYYFAPANWDRSDRGGQITITVGFENPGYVPPNDSGEYRAFVKADLTGVESSGVNKAELNLYINSSNNPSPLYPLSVHKITGPWLPGTGINATGGGANDALAFPDPGGIVTAENMPSYDPEFTNIIPGVTPLWVKIDITTLVQAWLASPGSNHGVMLRQKGTPPYDSTTRHWGFISSDYASTLYDGKQPYIEIFYDAGGADTDGDGVLDADDNCPTVKNAGQKDEDSDGFGDVCDICPEVADDQSNTDFDWFGDACDNCPFFTNYSQNDTDGDGIGNACDTCPNDADNDADGDKVCGNNDNCPEVANNGQEDEDKDGIGDACDACLGDTVNDSDGDGVCDADDQCPGFDDNADADSDNLADGCDTCPNDANNDADSDGVCGDADNCPSTNNPTQADGDSDGFGDVCDACPQDANNDADNDGVCGNEDQCPNDINKTVPGVCGCGEEDVDSDSDGTFDCEDGCPTDPDKTEPGDNGCQTPEDFILPGTNRTATPVSGLFINFGQVIGGGMVNVSQVTGAQPPAGYRFVSPAFDIGFSGSFSGKATLCFDYDESKVKKAENLLRLMHRKTGQDWNNITTDVDTDNNSICGETESFSEFAVVEEAGSSSSSGCFIATAAYGSYWEPHVMTLRKFRDSYLLTNKAGSSFVKAYYRYSPPIADFIAEHDSLRQVVRIGLAPLVGFSWLALHFGATTAFTAFFCFFVLLAGLAGGVILSRRNKDI